MRTFVALSCATLASVASAADLPPPVTLAPPSVVTAPTPIAFNWTGFYFGGHAGYGYGYAPFTDGYVVGGQAGVNYEMNGFVIGAEVDGSFVDWGGSDSVSSVRARGGFAHQRIFVYATGGIAFRDLINDPGWIVGGGIEYAVTNNWVVGAEYLYSEFDPGIADVFRGRVSYRFGGFGGTAAAMTSATPLAFNWTGFYLGAHGGYSFVSGAGLNDGYEVGGQVGVNKQYGQLVAGLEIEGEFVDWGPVTGAGSIRMRGGYAFDRFLVFAAGGMGIEDSIGWTVGGGAEYALTDHWFVGSEYQYHDFRGGHTAHIVRGRLSYLFDTVGGL